MTTPKTILFDGERCRHPNTGLYHYCSELYREIFRLGASEFKLRFLGPDRAIFSDGPTQESLVPLGRLNKLPVPLRRKERYLGRSQGQADLMHLTFQNSYYLPPKGSATKILLTIHDLNFLHEEGVKERKKVRNLATIQDRIRRADHLVFISRYAHEDARAALDLGDKPYDIIYNGCQYSEGATPAPEAFPVEGDFLFAMGTVNPKKNFHTLLPLIVGNELKLVIAGRPDPTYQEKIEAEARALGIADRILLTGPVSEGQKCWFYQNCLAFCFPSLAEGFGLPVIEAMSFGKPVFLSRLTSLPEVGGAEAFYFDDFDPRSMVASFTAGMARFHSEPEHADRLRSHAARFSWKKAASQYLSLYRLLTS